MTSSEPLREAVEVLRQMRENLEGSPGHRCRTERRALDVAIAEMISSRQSGGELEKARIADRIVSRLFNDPQQRQIERAAILDCLPDAPTGDQ